MRFDLDGLDLFFPYDYLYKEQYEYMLQLKRAIDQKGHALLEMPTGTGKTVCLISLITAYQFQYPQTGKLIYCTRTVQEMQKCMEEIKKVIDYRVKMVGEAGGKVLAICLSSRRNMCIHPRVISEGDREAVDSLCRNMTASWVRERAKKGGAHELCEKYENYDRDGTNAEVPQGVYTLDDLKTLGEEREWCPYFMTRHLLNHATIVVYNYQYMLDPKVSNLVSRELEAESIVVFDEAHNIDNVCIEALSVTLDRKALEESAKSVNLLQKRVSDMKASDSQRLAKEYADLVNGLADQGIFERGRGAGQANAASSSSASSSSTGAPSAADRLMANPVLSADILQEAVPGNIRKAEHFVAFLKKAVLYLKTYLRDAKQVESKTPLAFLYELHAKSGLERKALRFTYSRLNSLLRTLEVTTLDQYNALSHVANFVTLLATYMDGFAVITEPQGSIVSGVNEPLLQLCCLDASLAVKPVLDRFQSVIITSGTLSPIDLYPKLLNFQPVIRDSLPMSIFRQCLRPLIVTRGSDQMLISTKFEQRDDLSVVRNYGKLLLDVVSTVPDGVCCFFTSYMYMENVINHWDQMGVLQKCMEHKLVYLETKDVVETTLALDNYKKACDSGRGAVFLSIARGKVAEGIDFDNHYGRCVVLFGIPYQYTKSHVLRARLDYMREKYQIRDNDFLTFDALRQAAQCVGRVIRSKRDYGAVILADSRYNRQDKRSKFPPWITQFLGESALNLSVDVAVAQIKSFLKDMGQPIDSAAFRAIVFDQDEVTRHSGGNKGQRNEYLTVRPKTPCATAPEEGKNGATRGGHVAEDLFGDRDSDDEDPTAAPLLESRRLVTATATTAPDDQQQPSDLQNVPDTVRCAEVMEVVQEESVGGEGGVEDLTDIGKASYKRQRDDEE